MEPTMQLRLEGRGGFRFVSALTGFVAVALGLLLGGCSEEEPPDDDALTIAAVRVDPPSGQPGDTLTAEVLHAGRMYPDEDESAYEVAWLGGCHNPPSGEYYGCLPGLLDWVQDLSSPVSSTPGAWRDEHRDVFGLGATFAFELPRNIVLPEAESSDRLPYGVSYLFFAVCRGQLEPAPEITNTVPLRCVGAAGQTLGVADFAVGYATVFTHADAENRLPELSGLRLDGEVMAEATCDTDEDCASLDGPHTTYGCDDTRCLPILPRCEAADCPAHELEPQVTPESYEPNPFTPEQATEVLRLRLYSRLTLTEDDLEGLLPGSRPRTELESPSADQPLGVEPVWVVISDNRGAMNWQTWNVLVR